MSTLASRVDAAIAAAQNASEFSLSMAERENALQPIVAELTAMPRGKAQEYIRASFRGAGSQDAIAVALFKREAGKS